MLVDFGFELHRIKSLVEGGQFLFPGSWYAMSLKHSAVGRLGRVIFLLKLAANPFLLGKLHHWLEEIQVQPQRAEIKAAI